MGCPFSAIQLWSFSSRAGLSACSGILVAKYYPIRLTTGADSRRNREIPRSGDVENADVRNF